MAFRLGGKVIEAKWLWGGVVADLLAYCEGSSAQCAGSGSCGGNFGAALGAGIRAGVPVRNGCSIRTVD